MTAALRRKYSMWLVDDVIDIETYCLLTEMIPRFLSWHQKRIFSLNTFTEQECIQFFRFSRQNVIRLCCALEIPEEIKINRMTITGLEGLCLLLARLSSPGKLATHCVMFGRDISSISRIFIKMISVMMDNWSHLLSSMTMSWLSRAHLYHFADCVSKAGSPIRNIVGFIDGTALSICRPSKNQRDFFSGHKRHHVLKYQAITHPNGIIGRLDGAFVGKMHDGRMVRVSNLFRDMRQHWWDGHQLRFRLFGDKGYANTPFIFSPYRGTNLSEEQMRFNQKLSAIRVHAEYGFGLIQRLFPFVDYKKKKKILLQPVDHTYKVAAILTNCYTCLNGNQTGIAFQCEPPTLETYLVTL